MPRIIDYPDVQRRMTAGGFVSLYHNSGAFGFPRDAQVRVVGWVGPEDPSIRSEAMQYARRVEEPYAANLARGLEQTWLAHLPGEAWLMPKSHWHYELHFGNRELLETLLPSLGVDPELLRERNDGSAIAFAPDEAALLREAAERLLGGLAGSDFLVAFPDHRTACTIHHHVQLWWQTTDGEFAEKLAAMVG